ADLPTHTNESMLLVNNKGQMLIRTGGVLRLYDSHFSVLREKILPHIERYGEWQLAISPSGKRLLVTYSRPRVSEIEILDSSTFRIIAKWTDTFLGPSSSFSVSDSAIVKPDASHKSLTIRNFNGANWQLLAGPPKIHCVSFPTFVTDSRVMNGCRELLLLGIDGKLLMNEDLGENVNAGKIAVSQDGSTAVIYIIKSKRSIFDV